MVASRQNNLMQSDQNSLPYTDTKLTGAADFYMAINATFRFINRRFGMTGLERYWTDLGTRYFAPVSKKWNEGGLAAISAYWRAFFDAEPAAEVDVSAAPDMVIVEVKVCPAIKHLRDNKREILPCFCRHCYFISEAIALPAGFTVRVKGGNGTCRQTFQRREVEVAAQNRDDIREAGSC